MYNIYRNARRAALFFLLCLLTALVGLPIRGALATAAHESAGFATVQAELRADAAMPRSVAAVLPAAPGQNIPRGETYCGR